MALLLSVVCTGLKSITLFPCVPSYLWVCGSHYPWKKIVCFRIPMMLYPLPKRLVFASVWYLWALMSGNISNVVPISRFLAPSRLWYPGCKCTRRPIYKNNFYDFFSFSFFFSILLSTDTISKVCHCSEYVAFEVPAWGGEGVSIRLLTSHRP